MRQREWNCSLCIYGEKLEQVPMSDCTNNAGRPTVCQLLHGLEVGGAEMLAADLAEAGGDQFRFVFACIDTLGPLGEQLREWGYTVEVMGRKRGIDLGCARRLARFCRREHVGLIHAQHCGRFRYAALARWFGRRRPILLTDHGRPQPDLRNWRRVAMNRLLLRKSDRLVAVGQWTRQAMVDIEGFPAERVEVIYNGRDLGRYRPDPAARAEARRALGFSDEGFLVMQVARLSAVKDHATAVRAIARLAPGQPAVRLLLVGDGAERPALERLVDELDVRDRVLLLGARSDVERLLPAADAFLLSSLSEAIPLTLIEAMAAELPCIGSRVGGVPELIVEGETGLLAEPGSPEQFAHCIQRLTTDGELCTRMGAAGRRRAERLFDRKHMHAAYFAHYRSMLNIPAWCALG